MTMVRTALATLTKTILLLGISTAPSATFAAPRILNLCMQAETVVFSCGQSGKIVSVCASPGLSPTAGYLKYRFGKAGRAPELEYPQGEARPSATFRLWTDGGAKWTRDELRFARGPYEYIVFMQRAAFDRNGGGVLVEKDGKTISKLVCPREKIDDELDKLRYIGLPKAADGSANVDEVLEKAGY